ncbi:MAG: polysaccharide deacetylase family protein [Chloroflexota bacterium]
MTRIRILIMGVSLLLYACGGMAVFLPPPTETAVPLPDTPTALPPTEPAPDISAPVASPTPTPIPPPTLTFTASPVPTEAWIFQGPGMVVVPIILYHRIAVSSTGSQYYVPPEKFEAEMKLLHDWQYTTISTGLLIKAITEGADLPPRPIIITFDDGHLNNYTTAFPIMQKYGFTGVLYIVGSYMGADNYMDAGQIKEMAAAGWEVGSHSMTHKDLTHVDSDVLRWEVVDSREKLEAELGVPVLTFAYPYGFSSESALDYVHFAGYEAGMSLGPGHNQGKTNLYTLQRRDIKSMYDVKQFGAFLPWQGDPAFLPTDTPTPTVTPTRTKIPTFTQYPTRTP